VKTLPGIREAIEQGEWSSVPTEISRASAALMREATLLDGLAKTLAADAIASQPRTVVH
jgi:hypothetical protein